MEHINLHHVSYLDRPFARSASPRITRPQRTAPSTSILGQLSEFIVMPPTAQQLKIPEAHLFFAPDLPWVSDDALIAIDDKNERVVLAIRGNAFWPEFDYQWPERHVIESSNLCTNCAFEPQVLAGWLVMETAVLENLKRAPYEHDTYRLIVTGHSIGGAVACLAAAQIRRANNGEFADVTDLYAFGAPVFGTDEVAEWINDVGGPNFFIVNAEDESRFNMNVKPVYAIERNYDDPTPADIDVFATKSDMLPMNAVTEAHDHYFGNISSCKAYRSWPTPPM
ncbi:MAG: hypothetical protein LQ342_004688 [Letrouitia transgressa]|nr:MAG: hypothetical protein LQ342_004688 [Letrouitia transgressa]